MSLWAALEREGPPCGECGAEMVLKEGKFGSFWACPRWPQCTGTHGAHPDGTPLGVPADQRTKEARIQAHAAFDQLWLTGAMSRRAAYRWLQETMGMSGEEAHIGRFTAEQCEQVIQAVTTYLGGDDGDE